MRKRLVVFFLIFIYIFNNIFVNTTLCKFRQEETTEKFSLNVTAQKTLSDYSWQEIYDITVSGKAKDYWKVGDKTTVNVNGEDKEVVIIGFDHDGKNTVTFLFKDAVTIAPMNIEMTTVGGWKESDMRKITLPTILDSMGNKDFIKEVEKNTIKGYTDGGGIVTGDIPQNAYDSISTTDKLFLLSYAEVFDSCYWDGEGVLYEYFNTTSNHIMTNENGNATWWWLRTPVINIEAYFYFVNSAGVSSTHLTNYSGSVMPAFVIGETTEELNTLDLLPPFEMPTGFISGESFIISEMPDFDVITENAIENMPENTEFYGWLLENEVTQEIFNQEDAKFILEDIYSYEEKYLLRVSPIYKMIEESKLINVNIENLVNVTVSNIIENSVHTEQNLILQFNVEESYDFPEMIEIIIDDISYLVNTNGNDNPNGFSFNSETLELIIYSEVLLNKENLTIKAEATEIVKEVVEMLDGNNSLYELDSEEKLVFRSEAPLEELQSVEINGETLVNGTDYVATEGSTVITLNKDYLSNLEIGEYTISIISTRMIATTTFTVEEKEKPVKEEIEIEEENSELEDEKEIVEKSVVFETERLYNVEITEFVDLRRNELTIEEDLELEFVLEEDYVLYKNIEILINNNSYVLDLTDKEQELEGITFDEKDSILTISYDLFEEENTLSIVAIALEDIPTDELVLGKEISITEFIDVEELLKEIEILEDTEFIGWLINDENLEIQNIIINEEINTTLTKIYENKEEVLNNKFIEILEEILNENEEIEEIETLLTPVFRVVEKLDLEDYVLGESTIIYEIPEENALQEIIEFNLDKGLLFYGWLVETEDTETIVLQEELSEILNEFIEDGKEIILTPLYVIDEISEQPEQVEEETESAEQEELPENENLPEDNLVEQEPSGDDNVSKEENTDPEVSVEEGTDDIPDTSIPTEQIITVNTDNLNNIFIPELSNENTISLTDNENLILSLMTNEEYELPKTVQIVVDKTYTINTNGEDNPSEIEYNVYTQEITISNSILTDIETIKIKGTANKVQIEEDKESTQEENTESPEPESSDKDISAEEDTNVEPPVEVENSSEDNLDNQETTETENVENTESTTEQGEEETEEISDSSLGEQEEQSNEIEDTEQNATETLPRESETDTSSDLENEDNNQGEEQNVPKEDITQEPIENDFVEKEETDNTDTSTGIGEDNSSSSNDTPETSPVSSEPAVQSNLPTQTTNNSNPSSDSSSQNTSTSSSGSSPEQSSSSTSSTVGTTTKKSEVTERNSESTSSEE